MKKILNIILVLTTVGVLSGGSLVLVYNYTNPKIKENQEKSTKDAIFKVFPGADTYERIKSKDNEIYKVKSKKKGMLGYAFIAEGNGYQGKISIMVGVKKDLKTLTGIEILESQETPGLGQEITSDNFKNQFKGLSSSPKIEYVKGEKPSKPNQIEAITGATISSKAVVGILNSELEKVRKAVK